ncbi:MAG TPA: DUF3300 domain-containing protein [Terriglobales bacterium]|nr:DUF3300 domain-containing protein [Terriglobales bacterium]
MKSRSRKLFHGAIVIIGLALLSFVNNAFAQQAQSQEMTTTTNDQETTTLAPEELDSLVAPIALYPDPLLAQTLAASTYPLEVVQLQQWMNNNKDLKGKALADAVAKQPWDPSIQALVEFPDVVQRMAGNIQWTTDLGNAFLAQQSDVMNAIQSMRAKAQGKGTLKTSAQSVVKTETIPSGKQVIQIQQANPDVVYVPSYDPTVVYGAPPPAYPYYPYTYPGYVPGTALAWGAGIALGAAAWGTWGGGGWGWNCGWGHGNVDVNINNKYVNNYNKNVNKNFNQANFNKQGGQWQHNPQHRGNAPYGNRDTANKFGGQGPRGQGGAGNRPNGAGNRPGGGAGAGGGIAGNRPGGGAGAGNRPGGGGAGAKPSTRPAGGTAKNQVGNRTASSRPSSASRGGGGFSGGSGNYARASSNRGGHSMGGGGGGMSRGGGGGHRGGGGGHRGGGGGGRRR